MKKLFTLVLISLFYYSLSIAQTTRQVPSQYSTIQAAINAAVAGDTILVQPGIYLERINFNGKDIVVSSTYIISNDTSLISGTIIDGNQLPNVVTFNNNETINAKLIGFTIQNGFYNGGSYIYNGAGILIDGSSPEISHCTIKDNYISWYGGGICIKNGSEALLNSLIISDNHSDAHGGGIAILSANPKMFNLVINNNSTGSGWGGGIYIASNTSPEIINCTIFNNSAAGYSSHYGGGIATTAGSEMIVLNSIVYHNNPNQIDDEFNITHPIFYSDIEGGYPGQGNINLQPLIQLNGPYNYSLPDQSPCIGKGIDSIYYNGRYFVSPAKDILENIRPNPALSFPDLGAFENANADPVRSTVLNVPADYATIQSAILNSINGDTIIVQQGTYVERINFDGRAIIIASNFIFSSDTSDIINTIIDGNNLPNVVTFNNLEGNDSKLIGFTIQNGHCPEPNTTLNGAGILINGASPEIKHCIIKNNNTFFYGGGVCLWNSTNTKLSSLKIYNNHSSNHGGGIAIISSNAELENLQVTGNTINFSWGGGIYVNNSNVKIINCTVAGNSSMGYMDHYGGGISTNNGSSVIVLNSILWSNSPDQISDQSNQPQTVLYSNIQGGYSGAGNINDNPKFANSSSNDFRLSNYSPSIGVGIDSLQYSGTWYKSPDKDFDLNPRPNPAGSNPDQGAFENSFATQQHKTLVFVPGDYSTIQAAIDERIDGDTVLIASGVYNESINFNGKEIIVTSSYLFSHDTSHISSTIINGNQFETTVTINVSNAKLIGLSIINGYAGISSYPDYNPEIIRCYIHNHLTDGIGVGNFLGEIIGCKIYNNLGGGINTINGDFIIRDTEIFNNANDGIFLWGSGNRIIENCLIYKNNTGINTRGFTANPIIIVNSTITKNTSWGVGTIEGGNYNIRNSIIYDTNLPIRLNIGNLNFVDIDYTIIQDGINGIHGQSSSSNIIYGAHNINYDPQFVNSFDNNFRLSEYSPAIGSGTLTNSPLTDIEGNPRPNPSGSNPDIGAYESLLDHFNLLPPVLSSVLNGALNQPITVQLKWDSVYAAASYRFQFSTDSTFQTTLIDQSNISDTFFNLSSLNYLTKYYWRVNSTYPYDTSDWSETWNFTTIIEAPETPTLLAPADNSFNLTTDLNFNWNSSLRAEKYGFQLATDTLFQNIIVIDTSIAGTSRTVTGLSYNANYFWRVRAKNIGGYSSYSTIWNLRTKLQTPTLQSPANNSQNVTINPMLTWSSIDGAVNYHLQIALDPSFNQIVIDDSLLTNASLQIGPLSNSTVYYWRTRGYNGIYTSDFSASFNFTTIISNPNFPVLLSPANGSVNQPLNTTFMWEPVASATAYRLQVSADSLFGSFIINDSTITSTSRFVNLPNSNQKYFWRVQAKNIGGNSPFSSEWYLITVLPAPSLTSINAGNKTVQFNWNQLPLSNLLQNNIYRDVTPNPTQLVSSVPFNQTSFTDSDLTNGVTYYYRVKTVSVYGVESEYSNQLSAAPHNSPPAAVVLNPVIFPNEGRVLTREVSFSDSGSFDPDGSIDSTKWYVNDDFISYGNNLTYPFPQGTHSVKLVVIDNDGESDTSTTTVTRSMFTKNVNGQVFAGLSLIGSDILYAIVNGDAIYRMDKDGNIDYTLQVGGNLLSSSSIANDSTVYIGSTDNNIYAFSKNGTSLWVRPLGGAVTTTPTIDILNDRV